MAQDMGLGPVALTTTCFKRRNRWLFHIDGISTDDSPGGVPALPPFKSSRPGISFKEMEAQHLNEVIYRPGKPDWKTVSLTLYDIVANPHPIFDWITTMYDVEGGNWTAPADGGFIISSATLDLYDGCGNVIETWTFEDLWPQDIQFGELDMASGDVLTCDLTLRYDRAYISGPN